MTTIPEMFSLARQHQQAGGFAQAEQLYRQILHGDPSHIDAYCFLGEVCETQGKLPDAEISYRRAIQLLPGHARAHNWLGIVLARQGRLVEAVASFKQAVRCDPNDAETHHNLAVAFDRQGQTAAAIDSYRQALQLQPSFAQAHYNLGLALNAQDNRDEAIEQYRRALQFKADYPEALNDLGNALAAQEKLGEAVSSYQKALRLRPHFADAHYNLGIALGKQQQHDEAMAEFRQALRFKPDFAEAHVHLGDVHRLKGEMDEALACFKQALRLKPALPGAHWNRALLLLLCGDFEQGWQEYEWRWAQHDFARRQFPQPQWDGSDLRSRTILLHAEQGLGDTMHIIRYLPLVKQRGGNVIVECQPQLLRLLAGFPGIDALLSTGSLLPPFDVQAPLLSLPGIFHTTTDTIPRAVPYLQANVKLVEHWRHEMRESPMSDGKSPMSDVQCPMSEEAVLTSHIAHRTSHFLVGIAWQGSVANPGDRQRSIPLACFAPLAQVPGVKLISLQKGPGTEQLCASPSPPPGGGEKRWGAGQIPVLDLASRLDEESGAFMDTAAVMKSLDLVVCTDTAVAHLAGALAVPVWLALTTAPDWRWLLKREDSPWYPTMRLFRQTRYGRWEEVFERMAGELRTVVSCQLSENHLLTTDNRQLITDN